MRTLIIDNYLPNSPQTENLYNAIKDITVHTVEVREYSAIYPGEDFKLYDVIVVSGSQHLLAEFGISDSYVHEADFLKATDKPVLGICFGHQLIAMAFGSGVVDMGSKIDGFYIVEQTVQSEICEGVPKKFAVRESHREMVTELPFDFEVLGASETCPIEMIKHRILPIYGVQFHPERFDAEHPAGRSILENFFKLATWYIK